MDDAKHTPIAPMGEGPSEQHQTALRELAERNVSHLMVKHGNGWQATLGAVTGEARLKISDSIPHAEISGVLAEAVRTEVARGWQPHDAQLPQTSPRLGMAASFASAPHNAARGFGLVPAGDLLATPRPADWLIRGVIVRDSLTGLVGDPSAGKSFLALDWAAHITSSRTWNGRKVAAGPVVYLAGEGHGGFARRLAAWELHQGASLRHTPLYFSRCPALLDQRPDLEAVCAAIDTAVAATGTRPAMIVVDTMARHAGGDENAAKDASAFVRGLDALRERYGATVLVIHHSGVGEDTKMRARGSSAFRGALDTEFVLLTNKDGSRTLHNTKSKESEPLAPIRLRLDGVTLPSEWNDDDGQPQTSAVVVYEGAAEAQGPQLTATQLAVLGVARELGGESGRVSRDVLSAALTERGVIVDRKQRHRVFTQLAEKGALLRQGDDFLDPERLAARVSIACAEASIH